MFDTKGTINSWCTRELAHWLSNGIDSQKAIHFFNEENKKTSRFVIFYFDNGKVTTAEKPNTIPVDRVYENRTKHYINLFSQVAHQLPIARGFLGMYMGDMNPSSHEIPYFCFQKKMGAHSILLPDIDFLRDKFYEGDALDQSYENKLSRAIFAGSTSGQRNTKSNYLSNPRISAGLHFKNDPDVDFYLPKIVQCDSPETEALIKNLELGLANRMSWKEQLQYRFIISMDGNGATCSRVARTLKSNSVLLKYTSPHILYYFPSLLPWQHYIPINNHNDINQIIQIEKKYPEYFKYIANNSTEFYNTFLTKEPILEYTKNLLSGYFYCFY